MKIRKSLGAGGVIWLRRAGIAGRCTKGASLWLGQPLTQSRVDIVVRLQLRCGKSCKTRNGRPDENEIVFRNNGYKMRERDGYFWIKTAISFHCYNFQKRGTQEFSLSPTFPNLIFDPPCILSGFLLLAISVVLAPIWQLQLHIQSMLAV